MSKYLFLVICILFAILLVPVVEASEVGILDTVNVLENVIEFDVDFELSNESMTCSALMGPNLMKIIKFIINTLRIVGSIMAVLIGMTKMMSAVNSGDQKQLNKALTSCVWMGVVLILIIVLPILLKAIGNLFGFDTTCIP